MKINFRYFWFSLLLSFQAILLWAQAPEAVNYQAVARNASGQLIASSTITGKFVVRLGSLSGTLAYEESFSTQTNAFGVFSVKIGEGTPLSGTFNAIAWSEQSTFLEVWLDVNGGTNYQLLSQSQFVSVPYALSAKHVSDASNIQLSDLGDVEGQPNNGQVLQWNGAAWVPATVNAGTNGVDGRTILNGTSNPTAGQGAIGDFFINTTTDQIFGPKTAGGWGSGTSLIGPAGATGATGPQGPQGPAGANGAPGATGPAGPQGPAGANGVNGADGRTILNGTSNPTAGQGAIGDFFINTATDQIFGPKTAGGWGSGTSLVGPAGATGATGPQGPQGPQGQTGANGATGATGPAGPQGPAGTNGSTVLSGTSNPTVGQGTNGDFFINTTTRTIFGPKTAGAWGTGTSLVGPQGPAGATGPQGPAGANGTNGAPGATGPAGPQGPAGANGSTVLSGTSNPTAGQGTNGDFFINTTTRTIFGPKTAGGWGSGTSLIGPQGPAGATGPAGPQGATGSTGATGPQGPAGPQGQTGATGATGAAGANGSAVLNGTSNPTAGQGAIGDFYINTTTDQIFGPKTAGGWGTGTSLVGPAGPQGATGPAGTYTAGPGISLLSNVITNTGDIDASNDVTTTSTAGGDITGVFSNLQIASGAVGSSEIANGSIGAADIATGVIPTALPPNGAASGDLAGTYPSPTVDGLQNIPVSAVAPTNGQVLKYNGTNWAPAADNSGFTLPYTNTVNSTSTLIAITNSGTGGSITGITAGNASVAGLFGESTNASGGNGVWGRSNGAQGYGVWGTSTSGVGVTGETNNTTNAAGRFANAAAGGSAIELQGGIKVSGTATNRAAFQITASGSNLITLAPDFGSVLRIDSPFSNNNSSCMLYVTPVEQYLSGGNNITTAVAPAVFYDATTQRWYIKNTANTAGLESILSGQQFNVMIVDF